jgi:hypothetical protein
MNLKFESFETNGGSFWHEFSMPVKIAKKSIRKGKKMLSNGLESWHLRLEEMQAKVCVVNPACSRLSPLDSFCRQKVSALYSFQKMMRLPPTCNARRYHVDDHQSPTQAKSALSIFRSCNPAMICKHW